MVRIQCLVSVCIQYMSSRLGSKLARIAVGLYRADM